MLATTYWLDIGNNAASGQYILGQPLNSRNRRAAVRLRTVSELYPEIVEEDQIRVNVLPKKLADGENAALTTPMSFTGTAAELDAQLPDAIVSFVASHLEFEEHAQPSQRGDGCCGQGSPGRGKE
jgi:PRTRC genetic system protein E